MKTESDLRSTLNLPKTDFPMKANQAQSEPQRRLPSEKLEQTSPAVQSWSLEQVSHSSPVLPQEPIGKASISSSPNAQ